ncbi:MAG TPA: alpha/beta fold hydrolase [Mycobacteriales bacterium]|nr:alpha/beta fold hydrolase [Mycobacteriales bacterium]
MSTPRHLDPDPLVRPEQLAAASGELAALVATPPDRTRTQVPVLLVPGYTGSKEDFWHLLPLLARAGHPAIAIDLRGQFESGGPEDVAAYSLKALAADVSSLVTEPTHLVGHSFGGLICRRAVLDGAPARSLTLLSSGPGALGGTRGQLIELMRPLLEDGGVPAVWEAAKAIDAADPNVPAVPLPVATFLERRFLASPKAALLGMGVTVTTAPDETEELAASGIPTFVLHGDSDDAWPLDAQREMARRLGARHLELAGCGHSPAVDDPDATADALLDFWAAVDGR